MAEQDQDRAAALAEFVGDGGTAPDGYVAECATTAQSLVHQHIGGESNPHGVPADVLGRAVLEVGAELYHRRSAPSGIRQFASEFGSAPVRVARDPMVAAYPLLAAYLPGPFG